MKVQTMKTEMKKIDKKDFLRGRGLELTYNIKYWITNDFQFIS